MDIETRYSYIWFLRNRFTAKQMLDMDSAFLVRTTIFVRKYYNGKDKV